MDTKVVIEHPVLRPQSSPYGLQVIASIYVGTAQYRIYAPPKASGPAIEWLAHVFVHELVGDGENETKEPLRSNLIRMTRDALEADSQSTETKQTMTDSINIDKRRVFVVYGRNTDARDALFTFLRAIDLAPIEWEEAVQMTGEGTPYIGDALEIAFSKSQAAVILLTGDDMARLGKRYLTRFDPPHEKQLTPQVRPNVLFEAGMAFGKYPKRTVIVALGTTRPFSDTTGRHVINLSNTAESRKKLEDRLKTAGCEINVDGKADWLKAGDFDAASHLPDDSTAHNQILRTIKRDAQFDPAATYKRKVWLYMKNDGDECVQISEPSWKPAAGGIGGTMRSPTIQIRLGTTWCPPKIGVDHLSLPPGEACRVWIEPDEKLDIEHLKTICQSEAVLGNLHILINGNKVIVPV